jgi:hypothetical protein
MDEIELEIFPEVGFLRIVAVAENYFTFKESPNSDLIPSLYQKAEYRTHPS